MEAANRRAESFSNSHVLAGPAAVVWLRAKT